MFTPNIISLPKITILSTSAEKVPKPIIISFLMDNMKSDKTSMSRNVNVNVISMILITCQILKGTIAHLCNLRDP